MTMRRKNESENTGGDRIFKNFGSENNFEVEKVGRKKSVILNRVNSNNINTDPNHINSNQAN